MHKAIPHSALAVKLLQIGDNIMVNREQIEIDLAQRIVDGMDLETLLVYAIDSLVDAYRKLSDDQLKSELQSFAPDMLED
jgi:hypothetical protein